MILKALHINPTSRKHDGRRQILTLLCDKIRTERRFLSMPYFTWWFEYGALEVFEPINGLAPRALWGEWEEFVEGSTPELIAAIAGHDEAVEELCVACARLQNRLESSSELQRLYEQYTTPEVLSELDTDLRKLFGARPPEHHLSYLAQLIVNATPPDCSPLYTIRALWVRHGQEFLALRAAESFRSEVSGVDEAARKLDTVLRLLQSLCIPPSHGLQGHASQASRL